MTVRIRLEEGQRDETLARLLNDLMEGGRSADLDRVYREHPDLADELRELLAVAQFADSMHGPLRTQPHRPARPAKHDPLPRDLGDFELLDVLGRGGMGVVYLARQKSLGRLVALKMVRDPELASPTERARFRAEAEAVARLNHPNIVTVYEFGEAEGQAYFCMEYVEGRTLAQRLTEGPLPPREAARLIAEVARAVAYAHEQSVLHRDLKPSNILLGVKDETPFLTDFGLAKRLPTDHSATPSFRTETGQIVGTPAYMPPEQAASREVGPTADVYSLGAILYECLTGRPPFQASSPVDALLMVIEQEPVPVRLLNPGCPRDLEMICAKCLQKPTDLRYQSAGLLAEDLEAFGTGESISTHASGLKYFLARVMRPTHHAGVLENWGLLWMWHSLALFLLCFATQAMEWIGIGTHAAYLALWSVGLGTWGTILWRIRRRAGPVLFVERQLAHAWAAGVCASIAMFAIEVSAGMPSLTLSPAIAIAAGMVFVFKAGVLSGEFYMYAAAMFLTAVVMPWLPGYGILLFGAVSALCFLIPGLKYHRARLRSVRRVQENS